MLDTTRGKVNTCLSSASLMALLRVRFNCRPKSYCWLFLYLSAVFLFSSPAQSQNTTAYSLDSNINQCVALRQGQTCYKTITLQWQAQQTDDYCIVELGSNKIIQCWQQQNQGSSRAEFESDSDTTYALRKQNDTSNLATIEIQISWVYQPKPSKSSGWRLF